MTGQILKYYYSLLFPCYWIQSPFLLFKIFLYCTFRQECDLILLTSLIFKKGLPVNLFIVNLLKVAKAVFLDCQVLVRIHRLVRDVLLQV